MYDYIKGPITRITPEFIVIEIQGIGWQLNTPNPYLFTISDDSVQVFTHLSMREDAQVLFGFQIIRATRAF